MYEGVPNYPSPSRLWQIVDRLGVSQIYTAPTALRSLMAEGDAFVTDHSTRASLRVMGTVGEPINPEAWKWYFNVVGEGRCSLVDTWWQTEVGYLKQNKYKSKRRRRRRRREEPKRNMSSYL